MQITAENPDIPDWLKPHMKMFCECGGVICDDGPYDAHGVMMLTQRWCSNPECMFHLARKADELAKYFHIDGFGPKTAQKDIVGYGIKNHLEFLRFWFSEPPEVYLYQAAELSYVYGVDSKWKEWLAPYTSYEEYIAVTDDVPYVILSNLDYLMECAKYFRIKKTPLSNVVIKVMITGSMLGFPSREAFLNGINEEFKDYFRVEDNKRTVRGTVCLVKEPNSVDYSKTQIAVNNNIPIVSSKEFIGILSDLRETMRNENEGIRG